MERIVDIATDDLHLSAYRGFMVVTLEQEEQGRIALDDVHAVIVHAHGVTWTTSLIVALAERGAVMVICAANHAPVAVVSPIDGHHAQAAKMRAQWEAPRPLFKQLWRQIIIAKISMQGSLLAFQGRPESNALAMMARRVRSGDPDNLEAQAARKYWPALMGADFRRDQNMDGANALLNYGYTIIRSCVARSIISAGLHPTIGLHHHNRLNGFALADDLVEPFRPLVDAIVLRIIGEGVNTVTPEAKRRLARIIAHDVRLGGAISPVSVASQRLAQSLARSFEERKPALALFEPPDALDWALARETSSARTMMLSGYRLMWIFVMFDLPVDTRERARAATKFREFLLDEGFEMSQFSIYARFCNGKEHYETYLRRIEAHLPESGEIHVLNFTDKQYENIVRYSSQRRQRHRKNPDQLAMF